MPVSLLKLIAVRQSGWFSVGMWHKGKGLNSDLATVHDSHGCVPTDSPHPFALVSQCRRWEGDGAGSDEMGRVRNIRHKSDNKS